jgi:hypothetical protein
MHKMAGRRACHFDPLVQLLKQIQLGLSLHKVCHAKHDLLVLEFAYHVLACYHLGFMFDHEPC